MAKRLTDADKQKIIADYINNQSFSETARLNNVNASTIKRLIDKGDYEELQRKAKEKKEETTNDMMQFFISQYDTKQRILKKLLKAIEEKSDDADTSTLKELATAYGIILDKEIKMMEMQRGNGSREDLMKVEELLEKIKDEAYK